MKSGFKIVLFFILFFLLSNISLSAQSDSSNNNTSPKPIMTLTGQINGPGMILYEGGSIPSFSFLGGSLKFDHLFPHKKRSNVHIGYGGLMNIYILGSALGVALGPNFVLRAGKEKHFYEGTLGLTAGISTDGDFLINPDFMFAYRFESPKNRFVFRLGTGNTQVIFFGFGAKL